MYHYVRDAGEFPFPGIHAVTIKEFDEQVRRLKGACEIVTLDDVRASLDGTHELPSHACLITFDDGLKDHLAAADVLRRQDCTGAFFVITGGFEGTVAEVHKIHYLLAKLGATVVVERFNAFQDRYRIPTDKKIDPRYRWDDVVTANLKSTLQTIDPAVRAEFLRELFVRTFGDERSFAERLYLSETDIRRMADADMPIGSHTRTHRRLDVVDAVAARAELTESKQTLERIIGRPVYALSYPYGNFTDATVSLARAAGYEIAFGTGEEGINSGEITRYAIRRVRPNSLSAHL